MNFKIIEKDSFTIVGKGKTVSAVNGEHHRAISAFWEDSDQNGFTSELAKKSGPMGLLGVCLQFNHEKQELLYFIGAEKNIDVLPTDWEEKVIPAASWAVFESIGLLPDSIQKVWEKVYSEWFPSSGIEHANAPELEVYPEGDTKNENYRCEVWIPIIK
jgi:AraC family transcriptional regulator